MTAPNPDEAGSDTKFAAGPSDRTGGSAGRMLGGLFTASGRRSMGTLNAHVYDIPRDLTDPGVAFTRTVLVPLAFEKVVGEMRGLAAESTLRTSAIGS